MRLTQKPNGSLPVWRAQMAICKHHFVVHNSLFFYYRKPFHTYNHNIFLIWQYLCHQFDSNRSYYTSPMSQLHVCNVNIWKEVSPLRKSFILIPNYFKDTWSASDVYCLLAMNVSFQQFPHNLSNHFLIHACSEFQLLGAPSREEMPAPESHKHSLSVSSYSY